MAFFALLYGFGLKINITASYPIGIYQTLKKDQYERGDFVFACLNAKQFRVGQHYLPKSYQCQLGLLPILKQVVGIAGDEIEVGQGIKINGKPLKNSELRQHDSSGNVLVAALSTTLAEGEYWLMSDYYPKSLDSRYLGLFSRDQIIEVVQPLWVKE